MERPGCKGRAQGVKEGPRKEMKGPGRTGRDQGGGKGQGGKARTIGGGTGHGGGITCCFSIPDEFGAVGSKGLTVYQFHYICVDDHNTRLVPNISLDDHNSFLVLCKEGVIPPLKSDKIFPLNVLFT